MGGGLGRQHAVDAALAEALLVAGEALGEIIAHERRCNRAAGCDAQPATDEGRPDYGDPVARKRFPGLPYHLGIDMRHVSAEGEALLHGDQDFTDAEQSNHGNLVAVIGLFGISEILVTMEESLALRGHVAHINPKVVWETWKTFPRHWITIIRSAFIGCWLGITPGGAIAASFMGYNLAKRFARDKERFGKGRVDGVLAPETAAHAAGTAALLPMLALGIPGSGTAAILLGGLLVWGLNPGPL